MTDKDSEFESDSGSGITSVSVQEPMSGKELCARLRALNPVLSSQDIELKQQLLAKEKTFKASHETCSKEAISQIAPRITLPPPLQLCPFSPSLRTRKR